MKKIICIIILAAFCFSCAMTEFESLPVENVSSPPAIETNTDTENNFELRTKKSSKKKPSKKKPSKKKPSKKKPSKKKPGKKKPDPKKPSKEDKDKYGLQPKPGYEAIYNRLTQIIIRRLDLINEKTTSISEIKQEIVQINRLIDQDNNGLIMNVINNGSEIVINSGNMIYEFESGNVFSDPRSFAESFFDTVNACNRLPDDLEPFLYRVNLLARISRCNSRIGSLERDIVTLRNANEDTLNLLATYTQ